MKRTCLTLLTIMLAVSLSGCSTMKTKFIRQKKKAEVRPQIYEQNEYVKPFSNSYYYSEHFTLWRSAHQDIIKLAESNEKARRRAVDQAIYHLSEMASYITPEKRSELNEFADEIKWAANRLENNKEDTRAISTLDRTLRRVNSGFAPSDAEAFLIADEIKL